MPIQTLLNYSVKPFQFLVGGVDLGASVVDLTISRPRPDFAQPYSWRGNFTIAWTLEQQTSIPSSYFSEFSSPSRWRRGLSVIQIVDDGNTIAKLRLDDSYRYDPVTGIGTGNLIDVIELLSFNRTEEEIPEITVAAGVTIRDAVQYLCNAAGRVFNPITNSTINVFVSYFPNPIISGGYAGVIDVPIITRNPLQDAQKLLGLYGAHLYVDVNEVIRDASYFGGGVSFSRGSKQVEISPDRNNFNFCAERVIVSGSRKVVTPNTPDPSATPPQTIPTVPSFTSANAFDSQGRLNQAITISSAPLGAVNPNPNSFGFNPTLVITERKVIDYYYGYKLGSDGVTIFTSNVFAEKLLKTITTKFQPKAIINPNAKLANGGWQPELIMAERYLETPVLKRTEQQEEIFNPTAKASFDSNASNFKIGFYTVNEEVIAQPSVSDQGYFFDPNAINPANGEVLQLEPAPVPEPLQAAADFITTDEQIKGEYNLSPSGYTLFYSKLALYSVGFIPSVQVANNLAMFYALLELEMRDAWLVEMPVPIEYKTNNCIPFQRCNIGDKALRITQEIYTLSNEGKRQLTFTGGYVGALSPAIPNLKDPAPFIRSGSLQLIPISPIVVFKDILITSITLASTGGTAPYTYTAINTLPTGLSLSSGGVISGAPTTPIAVANYTIRVTDAVAATNDLAVSITILATPIPIPIAGAVLSFIGTTGFSAEIETGNRVRFTFTGTTGYLSP